MEKKKTYFTYIKELLSLASPMIVGNLGMILIGAGDVFVAARYSTNALASIGIANSIVSTIFLFGIGLLISVSPLLSNFRGARQEAKKYFLPTINFAMILALISSIIILSCIPIIDKLNYDSVLVPDIKKYMFICAFSTFGAYLLAALKEYLQAFEIVLFPNLLNLFGVLIHLALDFIFVFGLFGCPAMGTIGLAISTVLSRTILGLVLLFYCFKFIRVRKYKDYQYFINLLKIGFPIAISILLEVGAFNLITIVIGRVSGLFAAAQNLLIVITTATFMIPLAISNAIAVKVGFANGAQNYVDLKRYAVSGVMVSVGFMAICALNFILFPEFIIKIFTNDNSLIKISIPILLLAGFFQIFDGLQVSLSGVFKGIKKTNIVMLGNFTAYWVIGLPLGFIFAFNFHMNLFGFWVGATVAIFSLSMILLFIILKKFKTFTRI